VRKFLVLACLLIAGSGRSFAASVTVPSSVILTVTPENAAYGSLFTLVAAVQDRQGNPVSNGSVTFYDGATPLGTVQVVNTTSAGGVVGAATLKTILVPLGSNSITATYSGGCAGCTSAPVSVTVTGQYPTTAAFTASGNTGAYLLTATLLGTGPIAPTGSVLFIDSTTGFDIGAAPINSVSQAFVAAPAVTGVAAPFVAALADLNGDGIPDLVTGSAAGLFVQLGNAGATFKAPIEVSSTAISSQSYFGVLPGSSIVFGDFNGDGIPDMAFVACGSGTCALAILVGNGDGTFQPERDYDQSAIIGGIATGDFNGDGIQDIALANYANGTVDLLLGNSDGTFQDPLTTSVPGASSVAAADLNGDGQLDLVVSNWNSNTVTVLLGNGDGTFQPAQPYPTGSNPSNVTLADLRGAGKLDIVHLDANNSVSVLLGNGDGSFQPATPVYTPASSVNLAGLAVADVNGDGIPDLVLSDHSANAVDILTGNGDGTFQGPTSYPTGAAPLGLALADLNHDGRLDIAVANQTGSSATVLLNQVTQTATLSSAVVPGSGKHTVSATYAGDANFASATSNSLQLTAALATPTMNLAALPSATVVWAQSLSLSITLTGPNALLPAPTGTAKYLIDSGSGKNATLSAGTVTVPISQLSIGTHCTSVTYSGDSNYAALSAQTLSVTVIKETPSISWTAPSAIAYGTALSATQLNATASVAGVFVYSPAAGTVLKAGVQSLTVTFSPANPAAFTTATATVSLTVNRATPAITWAAPAAITYGIALSGAQLRAASKVAGTFAYSPAVGTVLTVGLQTLSVAFTPTDTVDYASATATQKIIVIPAKPSITWATPAPIAYGTALSATQLNATSPVPGTFAYTPAAGTVLAAGTQTLSVTLTPADTTDYSTATATVTQLVGPNILNQLSPLTVVSGHTATFTLFATGAQPLAYQWQYLSGSTWKPFGAGTGYTTSTLTTLPTTSAWSGLQLRVLVTDAHGLSAVTNTATLTVTPTITVQPVPETVAVGTTATFSVAVDGVPNLTYDWQYQSGTVWKDFGAGTGYNTAMLTTFNTTVAYNLLELRVVVTDGNGFSVASNPVKLTVGPAITIQPVSQTVNMGSPATFTVAADGAPTLGYQWQYWNGTAWCLFPSGTGVNTPTLTTSATTIANNGLQLRVVVTDHFTLTTVSNTVTLTVAPIIATQPAHQTVPVYWSATFSVVAVGVPNLSYQWQYLSGTTWKPFGAGTGYTTATLTTFDTTLAYNGLQLRVVVTDGNGLTVISKPVTLTVIL